MIGIILATGLLASPGARVSSETLRLEVSAPAEIMVGEPVKIRTTLTAIRDVGVHPAYVQVWLDRGDGFRPYHESSFGTASTEYVDGLLKRGAALFTERVIAVSGYAEGPEDRHFELAIPRPGRYHARVQYGDVRSNVVTMEAAIPNGEDNEVLAEILRRPELLSEWALYEDFVGAILQKLLDDFPSSRYLAYPRILAWRRELDKARLADHSAAQKKSVSRISEGKTAQLLAKLEGAKIEGTPFEEDRLLLVGGAAASLGDRGKARAAYERLAWRSPNTAAAMEAKRRLTMQDYRATEYSNLPR